MLYQGFWLLNCRLVPFRSDSVPLIACGFVHENKQDVVTEDCPEPPGS